MNTRRRAKLSRPGPLALLASAWGQEYEMVTPPDVELSTGVAVVMIVGPLTHRGEWWSGDNYDAIEHRVQQAFKSSANTVVLKLDSPGGDVDGCFECSRTLRAMARAAGKRLIAYVDETAASAAYALACAADAIYLPPSGRVGSIGVINMVVDQTAADAQMGLKFTAFTSGSRKPDGCPHVPLTPEASTEFQRQIDSLATMFFDLVAESRGIAAAQVQRLEAGMLQGVDAVREKLADGVMSWDALLALLTSGRPLTAQQSGQAPAPAGSQQGEKDRPAMKKYDMALSALRKLAEGGDEGAKLAVAMLEAEEKKSQAAEETPPPSEGDDKGTPPSEVGEEEAKKAAARAAAAQPVASAPAAQAASPATDPAMQMAAELQSIKAQLAADKEAKERAELLAKRPDFDSKVLAMLAGKPIDYLRFAVETFPKVDRPANPLAAAAQVQPTQGATQGGTASAALPHDEASKLRAAMGLAVEPEELRWERNDRVFPTGMSREAARKLLAANQTGGAR